MRFFESIISIELVHIWTLQPVTKQGKEIHKEETLLEAKNKEMKTEKSIEIKPFKVDIGNTNFLLIRFVSNPPCPVGHKGECHECSVDDQLHDDWGRH